MNYAKQFAQPIGPNGNLNHIAWCFVQIIINNMGVDEAIDLRYGKRSRCQTVRLWIAQIGN